LVDESNDREMRDSGSDGRTVGRSSPPKDKPMPLYSVETDIDLSGLKETLQSIAVHCLVIVTCALIGPKLWYITRGMRGALPESACLGGRNETQKPVD
jgi:hypothetical protein